MTLSVGSKKGTLQDDVTEKDSFKKIFTQMMMDSGASQPTQEPVEIKTEWGRGIDKKSAIVLIEKINTIECIDSLSKYKDILSDRLSKKNKSFYKNTSSVVTVINTRIAQLEEYENITSGEASLDSVTNYLEDACQRPEYQEAKKPIYQHFLSEKYPLRCDAIEKISHLFNVGDFDAEGTCNYAKLNLIKYKYKEISSNKAKEFILNYLPEKTSNNEKDAFYSAINGVLNLGLSLVSGEKLNSHIDFFVELLNKLEKTDSYNPFGLIGYIDTEGSLAECDPYDAEKDSLEEKFLKDKNIKNSGSQKIIEFLFSYYSLEALQSFSKQFEEPSSEEEASRSIVLGSFLLYSFNQTTESNGTLDKFFE